MGFFRRLLERPRPASELAPIAIDLKRRTVADVDGTTTRATLEERFGKPTRTERGMFCYEQLGLQFRMEDDRVAGISVFFEGRAHLYRWNGQSTPPAERDLLAALGPPSKREVDDEEIMLEWSNGPRYLGVDYSLKGVLVDLFVDFD